MGNFFILLAVLLPAAVLLMALVNSVSLLKEIRDELRKLTPIRGRRTKPTSRASHCKSNDSPS
jgi:hypothetical protein